MRTMKGVRVGEISVMPMRSLLLCTFLTGCWTLLVSAQSLQPMNCSAKTQPSSCTSYLYYPNKGTQALALIASNFNVNASSIFFPPRSRNGTNYMIEVNCRCYSDLGVWAWRAMFYPTDQDENLTEISSTYYNGLAFESDTNDVDIRPTVPMEVYVLCGCPPQGWAYLLSYMCQPGDTLDIINETFQSNEGVIQSINDIANANSIKAGQNLFIPMTQSPTEVATPPTQAAPIPTTTLTPVSSVEKSKVGLIVGIVVAGLVVLVVCVVTILLCWRRLEKNSDKSNEFTTSGIHLRTSGSSSLPPSLPFSGFLKNFVKPSSSVTCNVKRSITLPREAMDVFDQEKPVVFKYEEIIAATNNFSETQKLGQGAFGIVYSGVLREQNVAIKQMKVTKSKEFLAELKVLCKVHHTNLVELIGYSAGEQSLFLVYEFAENGALSDHLHRPSPKDRPPLSWTVRIQIALDAARGLEYIHEHTKTHYVHRDVKTSNILLDGYYRAKVADFGLAKLVEHTADNHDATTKVVGTFGYLAPEYVMDGYASSKTDVYAFGVVLFELLTGQHAVARTISSAADPKITGRRSLISVMLSVLKEKESKLKLHIDPHLGDAYPFECAVKVAKMAKACVEDEAVNRPDMKQVVFTLSQTLLISIEWEASLAGSSQIFSGLVQGR